MGVEVSVRTKTNFVEPHVFFYAYSMYNQGYLADSMILFYLTVSPLNISSSPSLVANNWRGRQDAHYVLLYHKLFFILNCIENEKEKTWWLSIDNQR